MADQAKWDHPNEVIAALLSTDSQAEWDAICEEVKQDGELPSWWHQRVIASNLAELVRKFWLKEAARG